MREAWIQGKTPGEVTADICRPLAGRATPLWWAAFLPALALLALGVTAETYQIAIGIGTWGLNKTVGWALGLADGQMFHILTWGQGNMPSYASQVDREDRWKVILYVRSLQKGRRSRPLPPSRSRRAGRRTLTSYGVDSGSPAGGVRCRQRHSPSWRARRRRDDRPEQTQGEPGEVRGGRLHGGLPEDREGFG